MFNALIKATALANSLNPTGPAEDPAIIAQRQLRATQITATDTVKQEGQLAQAQFVVPESLQVTPIDRLNRATVDTSQGVGAKSDKAEKTATPKLTEAELLQLNPSKISELPPEQVKQAYNFYKDSYNDAHGDFHDRVKSIDFKKFEQTMEGYLNSFGPVEDMFLMDKNYRINQLQVRGNRTVQALSDDLLTVEKLAAHIYCSLKEGKRDPRIDGALSLGDGLKSEFKQVDKMPSDTTGAKVQAMVEVLPGLMIETDILRGAAGGTRDRKERNELERQMSTRFISPVQMLEEEIKNAHMKTVRDKADRTGSYVKRGRENENYALAQLMQRVDDLKKGMLNMVHEAAQAGVLLAPPVSERFYNDKYTNPGKAPGNQSRE